MHFGYIWKNRLSKFIDNPMAILPFLKKRLYYNFIADAQIPLYRDYTFLNYTNTLDSLIKNNQSIVRFGDEIFDMLQGIGLYFNDWKQTYHKDLADKLKEVISSQNPKLVVAFNPELILKTKEQFEEEGIPEQWHFWTNSKIFLKKYINKDKTYGSALCFNPRYNTHIDFIKLGNYFKTKHVIILTSNNTRFADTKLGKTTDFIECPKSDAWDKYEYIKQECLALAARNNYDPKETLFLVSMSSAGKVLVYELAELGYTAWDTGQFFDLSAQKIRELSHLK